MTPPIAAEPVPLYWAEEGQILRVEGTRVSIDCILHLHREERMTPEGIAAEYPSVGPAKVYAVIAYYLRHKDEVDAYLEKRRREAEEIRREIESDPSHQEFMRQLAGARASEPEKP